MTRDELVKRFGEKIGKAVTLDYSPKGLDSEGDKGPASRRFQKGRGVGDLGQGEKANGVDRPEP
jgi:hypothetical protein